MPGYRNLAKLLPFFALTALFGAAPAAASCALAAPDSLDQLSGSSSTKSVNAYSHSYTPDVGGNLPSVHGTGYSYNSRNEITNTGFAFDYAGNPTSWKGNTATYDPENRMTSYGSNFTAGYRADGLRAWKRNSSATTYYYYGPGGMPVMELLSNAAVSAVYTFGADGLVSRHVGTASTFYTFDERGNVAQRLDSSCNVLTTVTSDDYGASNATSSSGDPYGYFGAQFGYYADSETSLYLLGHRYYDSNVARFLNQDPIGQGGGVNVYSFCLNNGINGADPSGLDGCIGDWIAEKVQGAATAVKGWVNNAFAGSLPGELTATWVNNGVDVVAGVFCLPHMVAHLGEGMGTYAGDPSEKNLAGYYQDLGNICSLGLMAAGGLSGAAESAGEAGPVSGAGTAAAGAEEPEGAAPAEACDGSGASALAGMPPNESWGRPDTLADHFTRHGGDFGSTSPHEYADQASAFLKEAQANGYPTKIDPSDGSIRVFHPATNRFGAYNANGTTRTFFKPSGGGSYWGRQPGRLY